MPLPVTSDLFPATYDENSLKQIRRLNPRNIVARFVQEESDYLLCFLVLAFAEVSEAEVAFGIEDVFGGPVAVFEVAPGGVVVVLDD